MSSPPAPEEAKRPLDADEPWRGSASPQMDLLQRTLALLPEGLSSLLDVSLGEVEDDWLDLLVMSRPRLATRTLSFPRRPLTAPAGDVTRMPLENVEVEVVTLRGVLEHVPDWPAAVREALRVASRGVLITAAHRGQHQGTSDVQDHEPSPGEGQLHAFDESSLDTFLDEARIRFKLIPVKPERGDGLLHWIHRTWKPITPWIAFWLEKRP